MAGKLGSVASFRKLMGRRLGTWDTFYTCLWPQNGHQIGVSVWDHGVGMTSISTSFLIAVIYWGFTAMRTPQQRADSIQFLMDLVDTAIVTRRCGFQLNLPRRGAEPIEVDGFGHFDLRTVVGPACCSSIESFFIVDARGCRTTGANVPQVQVCEATKRPHIVTFVVAALIRGSQISDRWHGTALTFLRQLGDVVNQAAPHMVQTVGPPLCCPVAATAVRFRPVEKPQCEEEALGDLSELPSLKNLVAALEQIL